MSISRLVNKSLLFRLGFSVLALLGLFVVVVTLPIGTRAKLESPQASQGSSKKKNSQRFVPGELLVRYKSEAIAANKTGTGRITGANGRLVSLRVEDIAVGQLVEGLRLVHVDPTTTLESLEALSTQPDVLYAEPNYIVHAAAIPNDPRFPAQQNLVNIGAQAAWDIQKGNTGVVVAVVDMGISTVHADLAANIWTNPSPGSVPTISGDVNGYNFIDNNGTIFSNTDAETHATHVAGIIGAVGNNGIGVTGVAWSVGLMSLKFLNPAGSGDTADAIRAFNYAKAMRDLWETSVPTHSKGANVRIINASFSGADFSQSFVDSITGLNNSGILVVAAAGNSDEDGTREPDNDKVPNYPASFLNPNVISVAASGTTGELASGFSHYGAGSVDLSAPGVNILSTTPRCTNPGPPATHPCQPSPPDTNVNSTYSLFDGTSMSAPHVSGAAALLWAQNPSLSVQRVKNLLLVNGDIFPSLIDKTLSGRRLNVLNSLQSLVENDNTAPGAVTNAHINFQSGRTFNIGWTSSGDDAATGTAALTQVSFVDGATVIPLKGVFTVPSGGGQVATVSVPFRHTSGQLRIEPIDNAGNQGTAVNLPVTIPLSVADPYTSSLSAPAALTALGSGTRRNLNADDLYDENLLPFNFPFAGNTYTSVTLSTNGSLYLGAPPPRRTPNIDADDVPPSPGKLGGYEMVAGYWADLDLTVASRGDAGIYIVQPNANQVIYRWQGVPCNYDFEDDVCLGGANVNFEIELNSNGVIRTRYGSGAATPTTVGIGLGAQEAYVIASHTQEIAPIDLTNAQQVTFTPRAATTSSVQFSAATSNVTEGTATLNVGVTRTGDTTSVATVLYTTNDLAGASECDSGGTNASSRCDYLSTAGKLTFAAGETSKTVQIPIIDDNFVEGPQTFFVTLSSPIGASLGTVDDTTVTINDGGVEGGANPIDNAAFFVRQHYVDFLNREPDPGGLGFWTNEITSCGSDPVCIDAKRVNVSAAFFLSIEFQQTGYLVYRTYKSAFGNLSGAPVPVAFGTFIRDTQQIAQGVQVGIGDWEAVLEANKQNYMLEIVQSQAFMTAYPNSMTALQFVEQLNTRAGDVLNPSEKAGVLAALGSTPADFSKRAAALRAVAEDGTLKDNEFNKAFVLMQYFGYMRRSPNDPPDGNYNGYNFWLGKLNSFGGDFVSSDMVKSFIVSGEYRHRFGQ